MTTPPATEPDTAPADVVLPWSMPTTGAVQRERLVAAVAPPGSRFATELARLKAGVGR